jgi:hypothetical protein
LAIGGIAGGGTAPLGTVAQLVKSSDKTSIGGANLVIFGFRDFCGCIGAALGDTEVFLSGA